MSWSRIMRGISIKGYRGFRPLEDLSVLKPWILYVSSPFATGIISRAAIVGIGSTVKI